MRASDEKKILAEELTPDGEELVLYRLDGSYHLRVGGLELMSSRAHGSEEELARRACAHLAGRRSPRVLIGGLGFGFTLRTALDLLRDDAEVIVCEVFESLLQANQGELGELTNHPLTDPRVQARSADVQTLLGQKGAFDAIILDVDNGPWAFTLRSNGRLYTRQGVARLFESLRRQGTLAIWATEPTPKFERLLETTGFVVHSEQVPALGADGGPAHTIVIARRL